MPIVTTAAEQAKNALKILLQYVKHAQANALEDGFTNDKLGTLLASLRPLDVKDAVEMFSPSGAALFKKGVQDILPKRFDSMVRLRSQGAANKVELALKGAHEEDIGADLMKEACEGLAALFASTGTKDMGNFVKTLSARQGAAVSGVLSKLNTEALARAGLSEQELSALGQYIYLTEARILGNARPIQGLAIPTRSSSLDDATMLLLGKAVGKLVKFNEARLGSVVKAIENLPPRPGV